MLLGGVAMDIDLLKRYLRSIVLEAKKDQEEVNNDAPYDLGSEFVWAGVVKGKNVGKIKTHRFETMEPMDAEGIRGALSRSGFDVVEVYPVNVKPNKSSTHDLYRLKDGNGEEHYAQITPAKSILTGQLIGYLAESAIVAALSGGMDFDSVVQGDSRLSKIARKMVSAPEDPELVNLREVYQKLVSLSGEKSESLDPPIEKGPASVGGGDAKVDVKAVNADIHVKYNDDKRLVGIQKPKGSGSKENARIAAVQNSLESSEDELEHGASTNIFSGLREDFVNDMLTDKSSLAGLMNRFPSENQPKLKMFLSNKSVEDSNIPLGVVASMLGYSSGMDMARRIKGLEAELLYKDADNRSAFIDALNRGGYKEALERDIVRYIKEFSDVQSEEYDVEERGRKKKGVRERRTYFFNFSGASNKKTGLIDLNSLKLSVKKFNFGAPDAAGEVLDLRVEDNLGDVNVYLYKVFYGPHEVMKVEFRSIDGGGHPPQLHLLSTAKKSGLFEVN